LHVTGSENNLAVLKLYPTGIIWGYPRVTLSERWLYYKGDCISKVCTVKCVVVQWHALERYFAVRDLPAVCGMIVLCSLYATYVNIY